MTRLDHAEALLAAATPASLTEAARQMSAWIKEGEMPAREQVRRLERLLEHAASVRYESARLGRRSTGLCVEA